MSNKGLAGIFTVFFLVIIAYGALFFLRERADNDIESVRGEYDSKYSNLISSNAKDAIDFRDRLNLAKSSMEGNIDTKEVLEKIESLIISGDVNLSSFGYDDKTKTISLVCVGRDYTSVARQILSFKKSEYFSSVSAGKTSRDDATLLISFNVDLKMK